MRLNGYIGTVSPRAGFIYRDGVTDYKILIPENASESEWFAASELSDIMKKAGVTVATVTDKDVCADPKEKYIALGDTVYFKSLGLRMLQKEYKFDGFIIESIGETYVIKGVGDTGTCFGAYGFAEYTMGYVYYALDEYKIEKAAANKEIHIKDIPTFFGRNAFSYATKYIPDHGFRLRINGEFSEHTEKHGEGRPWSTLGDQSNALQILDYRKYREAHPDWFYVRPENYNAPSPRCNPQICFSKGLYDDEFFETFMSNLINDYIIPESDKMFFMLGMSDTHDFCMCDGCCREVEKYTRSGLSMRFVNKVADAVEAWRQKNAPERVIYIVSFAYHTTFDAPVIKEGDEYVPVHESVIARDNVAIQFAPIKANYLYPLMDAEHNSSSRESILGWHAVAKHMFVWDYRQDFHSVVFPFPTMLTAQANNDTYASLGMMDVFNQAQRFCPGSPFIDMDNFARARLHWNASESYDELCDEFRKAYYKDAEPVVTEYYNAVIDFYKVLEARGYDGDCHRAAAHRPAYYTPEDLDRFEEILSRALKLAESIEDPELSKKVYDRVELLTLYYKCARLMCFSGAMTESGALALLADIRAITEKNNVEYYWMWNKTADVLDECEAVIKGRMTEEERRSPLRY